MESNNEGRPKMKIKDTMKMKKKGKKTILESDRGVLGADGGQDALVADIGLGGEANQATDIGIASRRGRRGGARGGGGRRTGAQSVGRHRRRSSKMGKP